MRDFLKKLFSGKEPESVVVAFETIPQLLKSREEAAKAKYDATTEEPVRNIRNAAAQLQHIVNTIAGAEHDPAIHPKLKSIAKNTLPQFIRSMNASLAKELPEDPDEFYLAAVECVKGCLNSVKGPGRYLQIVFPDEMKAARTGIDTMGREMNAVTAALGTYRKESGAITAAKAEYATILDAQRDLEKAGEKSLRMTQRIKETTDRIAKIDSEREDLRSDSRMTEIEEKRTALQDLEKQREETARAYAALSMTAAHVLRKAEKIATRQNHHDEIALIQRAMALLSHHELPDIADLKTALDAVYPVTARMIGAGEIALKNKEERAVFSEGSHFCSEICTTCSRLEAEEKACTAARGALTVHPVIVKLNSLDREHAQLLAMADKEILLQKELEDWQQKTRERIPVLREELRKMAGVIEGRNVQFRNEDQKSA
jgi:hypothetical protein